MRTQLPGPVLRWRWAVLTAAVVTVACGIRGPPRPAIPPPAIPASMQQQNPGRDGISRSPFEASIPDSGVPSTYRP